MGAGDPDRTRMRTGYSGMMGGGEGQAARRPPGEGRDQDGVSTAGESESEDSDAPVADGFGHHPDLAAGGSGMVISTVRTLPSSPSGRSVPSLGPTTRIENRSGWMYFSAAASTWATVTASMPVR